MKNIISCWFWVPSSCLHSTLQNSVSYFFFIIIVCSHLLIFLHINPTCNIQIILFFNSYNFMFQWFCFSHDFNLWFIVIFGTFSKNWCTWLQPFNSSLIIRYCSCAPSTWFLFFRTFSWSSSISASTLLIFTPASILTPFPPSVSIFTFA